MDRSHARFVSLKCALTLLLAAATLISSTGCPAMLATGVYLWEGGNLAPAECDALKSHRVVVLCKPPASNEYRNAGASRSIAKAVSELLVKHVKDIDVVNPRVDPTFGGPDGSTRLNAVDARPASKSPPRCQGAV